MANFGHSSQSSSQTEPLFTIQLRRQAAWFGLAALALVVGLVLAVIRSRGTSQATPPQPTESAAAASILLPPQPPAHEADARAAAPIASRDESSPERDQGSYASQTPPDTAVSAPQDPRLVYVPLPRPYPSSASQAPTQGSPATNDQPPTDPEPPAPAHNDPPSREPARSLAAMDINGGGAIFPYPLYRKWFSAYAEVHPDVAFSYQSIGSGAGIHDLLQGLLDFAASDYPMSDEQLAHAKGVALHVPTALGAVVPISNVPCAHELRFTPEILAGIFLGKITSWDDPLIAEANPRVSLPNLPIVVVHRADGSAPTLILTDYLSKVSEEWRGSVGKGASVRWPVGLGGRGNEGIAGLVRQTPGALGYVDLLYAMQNQIAFGSVRNAAGNFVKADLDNVTLAAASIADAPGDFRASITNPPGPQAYPLASLTWLLVPQPFPSPAEANSMSAFLEWMAGSGQAMTRALGYAPLPPALAAKIKDRVAHLR